MTARRTCVALLKRSDADLFFFHEGADWQQKAETLSDGHCFDVLPTLVAVNAPTDALQQTAKMLETASAGAGWYACEPAVAMGTLAAVAMPRGASHRDSAASGAPSALGAEPAEEQTVAAPPPAEAVARAAAPLLVDDATALVEDPECSDEFTSDDCEDSKEEKEEPWQWLEPCAAAEADKAVDIRTSLVAALGKAEARGLLACAKATVARDADGRKNRILRIAGQPVRLKREVRASA